MNKRKLAVNRLPPTCGAVYELDFASELRCEGQIGGTPGFVVERPNGLHPRVAADANLLAFNCFVVLQEQVVD